MIKILCAMTANGLIGKENHLPWKIPAELQHFKITTWGKTILFGRATYEGIGKVLQERNIIVLTRQKDYNSINQQVIRVINSIDEIVKEYQHNLTNEIYICGGQQIYEEFFPYSDELIISIIKDEYSGDSYFPVIDLAEFNLIKTTEYQEFVSNVYERKEKK